MKLEEREIADLHEMAVVAWERRPRMVRAIHFVYGLHVWHLVWLIQQGPR